MVEFSKKVSTDRILPLESELHLEADAEACARIAIRMGVQQVENFTCDLKMSYQSHLKAIVIKGQIKAKVVQSCVLSGEPVAEKIKDRFTSYFVAHADMIDQLETMDQKYLDEDIEVYEEGMIDVGELATQYLSLALNPFPRKSDIDLSKIKAEGVKILSEEDAMEKMRADNNPFKTLQGLKKN